MPEDKIADQKKWFKVWTTLLMDTHIPNEDIGMFTRLGCAIAFRGINGKLVTTNQALHSMLQIPHDKQLPQSFLDNFNVQIHENGNDKISVTLKNWYKYQVDNSSMRVKHFRKNVTRNVTMQDKIRVDKKRREKKEDKDIPNAFLKVWQNYPNKQGKQKALQIWNKLKTSPPLEESILKAIELQKTTPQWTKDNGQFIPHLATWLNQRRWEDELPKSEDDWNG